MKKPSNTYNYLTTDPTGCRLWTEQPVFRGGAWSVPAPAEYSVQGIDKSVAERMLKRKLHPCECVRLSDKTSEIIYF